MPYSTGCYDLCSGCNLHLNLCIPTLQSIPQPFPCRSCPTPPAAPPPCPTLRLARTTRTCRVRLLCTAFDARCTSNAGWPSACAAPSHLTNPGLPLRFPLHTLACNWCASRACNSLSFCSSPTFNSFPLSNAQARQSLCPSRSMETRMGLDCTNKHLLCLVSPFLCRPGGDCVLPS